jgi:hypothetical protein
MLDQRVMLLDFFPLVKLKKGVFNYITKRMRNGLSPGDQSYNVHEEIGFCVTQAFSKSNR